ncbi:MAG: ATP-binding cassette domain-containing protein [Collinsella sp.]|nr:ATP-binding cassette domain-containing protein [Collinsella sp.]
MDVIETRALSKAYGPKRAVDSLDMHVGAGDIYGFVGKNGAGKSTVMKLLSGLVRPTSGEMRLFGHPVRQTTRPEGPRMGALIEEPGLLPTFSAYENLMCKALALGVVHPEKHCRELLELAGLEGSGTHGVKKLSLGMRQRLGLALALVGEPDLLLLDEPFNGLDPEATREMRGALMRLNRERGITLVISSHVLDQLDRMATRFGVIRQGRMARELSVETLHAECAGSIRVKTSDPSRSLVILEERLPGTALRTEPDGSIIVGGGDRHARARFGGASIDPSLSGAPSPEDISRVLLEEGQLVLELSSIGRDIEEFFVELMGDDGGK